MSDIAIALTLTGTPALSSAQLQELYRLTGRSSVELRKAIETSQPLYTASLFGTEHLTVVPRLEKTMAHLDALALPYSLSEIFDGESTPIDHATMREILDAPAATDTTD